MTQEPKPRSLQRLSDDLAARTPVLHHTSTRTGLKVVDSRVDLDKGQPITDGPAEDEFLRRGWRERLSNFAFGWWRRRRAARQEHERDTRMMLHRMGSLMQALQVERQQFKLIAQQIAGAQARAEVRLKTLQQNHDVLRDALNAHADEITKLQGS